MAEERLTLLMRARGGRQVRNEVDDVGDAIGRVGFGAKRANDRVGIFSRGLTLLGTRMGMVIIAATVLGVVLGPPLIGAIALLTAGVVAFGGALIPIVALTASAVSRFNEMKDVAGTTAGQLASVIDEFQMVWKAALAPGADVLMGGVVQALQTLMPLVESMEGPLTMVAQAISDAVEGAAVGFAALGPEIARMFSTAAPLIAQMGEFFPALVSALIHLSIAGMPVLERLLGWLTEFSYWLGPALDDTVAFSKSAGFMAVVEEAWRAFSSVAADVGDALANLATIAYELYVRLEPLLKILGGAALVALNAFGGALGWVSGHMTELEPLFVGLLVYFGPLLAGLLAIKIATMAFAIAAGVLNVVLYANPIVLVIAAVVALGAVLYMLYHRYETVRNIIDVVWQVIRNSPLGWLVRWWIFLGTKLWEARGAFVAVAMAIRNALASAVDFVKPKILWLVDKIKWVLDKADAVADVVGGALGIAGDVGGSVLGKIPGLAGGTDRVTRGGAALVHRDEIVHLPRGAAVEPGGFSGDVGGDVVIVFRPELDGRVLTESTHRYARRKKSTS